jgi:two-component system sensor histidine kinase DegS
MSSTTEGPARREHESSVGRAYTPKSMEAARAGTDANDSRFEGLHAEASAAVGYSANTLRSVRERYREAYGEALTRWQAMRDDLEAAQRARPESRPRALASDTDDDGAAAAAEAGADDARIRALRTEVETLGADIGAYQSMLAKLELADGTLARTWLFLSRGDASLVVADDGPATSDDLAMRIVEAQEAERVRLAQDVHDGPAQALTNAIFQVEYIERIATEDPIRLASELRTLRDTLRRELANVRDSIHQLRAPELDHGGLAGAIRESAERLRAVSDITVTTELEGVADGLEDRHRVVALRIVQEALQNVRKHADASAVVISTADGDGEWVLEIRDDGRGFEVGAVAARGRRNFGLQFMRERAELIGAQFDVRSRPDGGTVVRLGIPTGARTGAEETS